MQETEAKEFYQYDPAKRALAKRYENVKLILEPITGALVPVALSLFLLFSGTSVMLAQSFASMTGSYWMTLGLCIICFVVFLQIVETPFSFYSGYIVDHRFHLSTQSLKDWSVDELKSLGIEVAFGVLAGVTLYYLIRTTTLWWLAAAALFAIFSILLSIILPYVLMPIFYKVTPLADPSLKGTLLEMSGKVGARNVDRVLVADESSKSVRANAFFSGIGGSKAIVLFDTLLNSFTRREVITVVAHELGHYVNKDIWKEAVLSGLLTLPPFLIADYALRQAANSLGLASMADPAGVPIIVAILVGVSFLLQPFSNGISRVMERRADEFALRAADDSDAQSSAERRLADLSLAVDKPNRLVELFFYSHPSSARRVQLAEDWKKEHTNK
ncbi:MAG: M48 family metallopeptidase [Candidatus Bathyarchaeia archaeon]